MSCDRNLPLAPHRRALIFGLASTGFVGLANLGRAQGGGEYDPADMVPRWFSVRRFLNLDRYDFYHVHRAVRHGRHIIIEGFTASESRRIIRRAKKDWPETPADLRRLAT